MVPGADPIYPDPATLAELTTQFPATASLAPFQQDAVVGIVNSVPAPCDACPDASLGRCAVTAPATCPNLSDLVGRVVLVLGDGGSPVKARDAVLYSDAWFPVPEDHTPLSTFTGSVDLQVFVDPAGSFLEEAVTTLASVERADAQVTLRFLPSPDEPGAADLSRGVMAAEEQGLGFAFLQATAAWRAANRSAERSGKAPLGEGASVAVASGLVEAGLDLERWTRDAADPSLADRIAVDRLLAEQVGVRATPTWFVNGYRLRGAQSARALDRLVQLEKEVQGWKPQTP